MKDMNLLNVDPLKKIIEDGEFTWELLEKPFSTMNGDCTIHSCPIKRIDQEILLIKSCNLWFDHWTASEVWVRIVAEIDGCNVKNARILPGTKSYIAWYAARKYTIKVSVSISTILASSGCPDCCDNAQCIELDVTCSAQSWIGSDVSSSAIIRLCGNDVTIRVDDTIIPT